MLYNSEALPVLASLATFLIKAYLILLFIKMQVYKSLYTPTKPFTAATEEVTPVAKRR